MKYFKFFTYVINLIIINRITSRRNRHRGGETRTPDYGDTGRRGGEVYENKYNRNPNEYYEIEKERIGSNNNFNILNFYHYHLSFIIT